MHRGISYNRNNSNNYNSNSYFYGSGRSQNRLTHTYNQTPHHVQANYSYKDAVSSTNNSIAETSNAKLDRLLKAFETLDDRMT